MIRMKVTGGLSVVERLRMLFSNEYALKVLNKCVIGASLEQLKVANELINDDCFGSKKVQSYKKKVEE